MKFCRDRLSRSPWGLGPGDICDDVTGEKGPRREAQLLLDMSRVILQHYGAPANRACKMREWCRSHFPEFWGRDESSGNSPIENLWAIVQEETNKVAPVTSEGTLAKNVRTGWSMNSSETLDSLMSGMPDRMLT